MELAMAVRFTTRLQAVRTSPGKVRVKFGYLGDPCHELIVVTGPDVVLPPATEMSDEEFDRWQFDLTCNTEYSLSYQNLAVDTPLVEAEKTFEDEIPKGAVTAELFWPEARDALGCLVKSSWDRAIPNFSITADFKYDAPQPTDLGAVKSHMAGGSISFVLPQGSAHGKDLSPHVAVEYYLPPMFLTQMKSRAASMSPETHWLSLRTDNQEFDRIPGSVVADFLEDDMEE
jgi:hypothetical protein